MIRVMVVDDHTLVRQGIQALLEKAPDIQLAGDAQDGQEALEFIGKTPPDVVIADVAMPRLNGIQLIRQVRKLGVGTRIVIVSMHSDEALVRQALKYGASGYLLKRSVAEELLIAVRAAARGDVYLSPEISRTLVDGLFQTGHGEEGADTPLDRLSPREGQVLQLVVEGNSNTKIGKLLDLSPKTIEKHRAAVMTKLGVGDLPGLIRMAIKHRLIFLDD